LTVTVRPLIVTVPERAFPELAAIASGTFALPDPADDSGRVIQDAFAAAVQAHASAVSTEIVAVPPLEAIDTVVGVTSNVQGVALCVIVTAWPFTSTLPVRGENAAFADIVKLMVPLPLPDTPPVSVIHDTCDATVQAHSFAVVTFAVPDPPEASYETAAGDTL